MKFFDPRWREEVDEWPVYQARREQYVNHVGAIKHLLPAELISLDAFRDIHDGLPILGEFDFAGRSLVLKFRCGGGIGGYCDLYLKYWGVDLSEEDLLWLEKIFSWTKTARIYGGSIGLQEVDWVGPGRFAHRLLFWVNTWFQPGAPSFVGVEMEFERLEWRLVPRKSRRIGPRAERFRRI